MAKVYPRYKVYIKKGAKDREGKRIQELTGATYTWTVSAVDERDIAELGVYSGTTSWQHVYDPPLYVPCTYLVVVEEACQHFTVEDVAEVAPTCTQTGWTAGTQCVDCKEFLLKPDVIPALGHDFVYDVIQRTRVCRTCGATKDEDQPVRIMQSDVTRLMNIVEEFMMDDASTKLDTTTELSRAGKVFTTQYTFTTEDGNDATRKTESPEGEFHIYFVDTQEVKHYLTLVPVDKEVILSHTTCQLKDLQSTVLGKDSLPSRFKIDSAGNVVCLYQLAKGEDAKYYLINKNDSNSDNNISIDTDSTVSGSFVKLYERLSDSTVSSINTTASNLVHDTTKYVMAAVYHGFSSDDNQQTKQQYCYATGIIVR